MSTQFRDVEEAKRWVERVWGFAESKAHWVEPQESLHSVGIFEQALEPERMDTQQTMALERDDGTVVTLVTDRFREGICLWLVGKDGMTLRL